MKKTRDEKAAPFYMLYKGLLMGFDLAEAVFMVYMNDLSIQRDLGYNTVRSKRAHLGYLGIGARLFDRCVAKCVSMGLMQCEVTDGKYEYLWDKEAYACLVNILSVSGSYKALREFCDRIFEKEKRRVLSVSNAEINDLKHSRL